MEQVNNDLILVRRTTPSMYRTQKIPLIGMNVYTGKFIMTEAAANIIGIKERAGVMFGFNKAAKTAYIILDNEPDAFIVTRKDKLRYRFCSTIVRNYMIDVFDLKRLNRTTYYFNVAEKPNKKGFFEITLKA